MGSLNSAHSATPALDTEPQAAKRPRLEHLGVVLLALIITLAAVLFCFFSVRHQSFDDLHLANISYMYAHYSQLSYPAHWQYQALTLHPPLHHLEMGLLTKAGQNPYYAEAVPVFLFFVVGIYLVVASRFPTSVKVALLAAFCVPFLNVEFAPRARPDVHRALAMFAGLIALESGRLANWNWKWLFTGSFLLTYASVLHYPGFLTWTGVAVYIVWIMLERGWRSSRRSLLAMIAGGLLIGLPFLLLFVIPHWHDILRVIREVDPMGGGIASSLQVHFDVYRNLYSNPNAVEHLDRFWPTRILFFPLTIKIPVILMAAVILGFNRFTRGIALAVLPYPLFLLLKVPNHKVFWPGYFLPELMLYLAAVVLLILSLLNLASRKMTLKTGWAFAPIAGFAMTIALLLCSVIPQRTKLSIAPQYHEDALARAAGRAILGRDALVASRSAIMWYAGGGTYYYAVDWDLLAAIHPPLRLKDYFSVFDAVVEHQPASSVTHNDEHKSLISWYADGTLNLRGMYLSHDITIPYLMLTASRPAQVEGFGLQLDGQMAHFRQEASGEYTFAAAICKQHSPPALSVPMMYRHTFLMPQQPGQLPEQMETYIFKTTDFIVARPSIVGACLLRDEIPLTSQPVEPRQLLGTLRDDQVVRFYEQFQAAADARWGPELQVESSISGWPQQLQFRRGTHAGEGYSLSAPGVRLLAQSDMNEDTVLKQAQYQRQTAPSFVPDGLTSGDRARSFRPQTVNDHLATDFYAVTKDGLIFFSLWANTERSKLPSVSIQDDGFYSLAQARPVTSRSDGWVLFAGWTEPANAGRVRLVVEPGGHDLRLDKLLLVELPRQALAKKRDKSVR